MSRPKYFLSNQLNSIREMCFSSLWLYLDSVCHYSTLPTSFFTLLSWWQKVQWSHRILTCTSLPQSTRNRHCPLSRNAICSPSADQRETFYCSTMAYFETPALAVLALPFHHIPPSSRLLTYPWDWTAPSLLYVLKSCSNIYSLETST